MINRRSIMDDMFGRPQKRCACCGKFLDASQFHICRDAKDGLQSWCKKCQKEYHEKHPYKMYKKGRNNDKSLWIW